MAKPLKDGQLGIEVKVTPRLAVTKLKNKLADIAAIPTLLFAQGRIEKLLLGRTKDRFKPLGATRNAQRDPSGRLWRRLSPDYRKKTVRPILVVSGTLRDAIRIVRSNLQDQVALSSPTGARARIGVPRNSPAAKYARIHQFGGRAGRNSKVRIPQRRFLGIGREDITAVSRLIGRVSAQQVTK